jgi:hypothetical protein
MRTKDVRDEIQRLLGQVPFRPFVITLENRLRIAVEHPENIGLMHDERNSTNRDDFYARAGAKRLYAPLEAVTSISQEDDYADEE